MRRFHTLAALCVILLLPPLGRAGLYYSGEPMAELPSQWRGFLLDQRTLRMIAAQPRPGDSASPVREQYQKKAAELEAARNSRPLSADELADLGALYVRLGQVD